jgi:GDP-mannose 6-dehydrogenase
MKISIFGLGYVGSVSAGCLANEGHEVIGVDLMQTKVDLLNQGRSPIIEDELDKIIEKSVREGRLRATTNAREAINDSEMSMLCVGTPSHTNGSLDLTYVRRVCGQIGESIGGKPDFHVVVVRSTMLPGSMRTVLIPILEASSGKKVGVDFGACNHPEFLREGMGIHDYYHPPKIVIGELDKVSGGRVLSLYSGIVAPVVRVGLEVAEMVKYTDNAWHALKVGFANEMGNLCKALEIDGHDVMDVFCRDTKLNISAEYLKPGFAFGGSCLPKDVRALRYKARSVDLHLPIVESILPSNALQVERGFQMIASKGSKKVGILGFSFKSGTDDLRESPIVDVIERLIGKGYDLRLFDRNVDLASLVGANREFILNHIPHISKLMVKSVAEVLGHADTVVIGNKDPEFQSIPERIRPDQTLVDFVRVTRSSADRGRYDGICW